MILHAGLIARHGVAGWRGVLIEGPSGSGKSDLALRALDTGFRLVADDRVLLWACEGRLFGRAPDTLHGLMEMRGLGVWPVEPLAFCEIVLGVLAGKPERAPNPRSVNHLGVVLPQVELNLNEPSAPAKLGRALATFDVAGKRRI